MHHEWIGKQVETQSVKPEKDFSEFGLVDCTYATLSLIFNWIVKVTNDSNICLLRIILMKLKPVRR
jgi:hypothetical protein